MNGEAKTTLKTHFSGHRFTVDTLMTETHWVLQCNEPLGNLPIQFASAVARPLHHSTSCSQHPSREWLTLLPPSSSTPLLTPHCPLFIAHHIHLHSTMFPFLIPFLSISSFTSITNYIPLLHPSAMFISFNSPVILSTPLCSVYFALFIVQSR